MTFLSRCLPKLQGSLVSWQRVLTSDETARFPGLFRTNKKPPEASSHLVSSVMQQDNKQRDGDFGASSDAVRVLVKGQRFTRLPKAHLDVDSFCFTGSPLSRSSRTRPVSAASWLAPHGEWPFSHVSPARDALEGPPVSASRVWMSTLRTQKTAKHWTLAQVNSFYSAKKKRLI